MFSKPEGPKQFIDKPINTESLKKSLSYLRPIGPGAVFGMPADRARYEYGRFAVDAVLAEPKTRGFWGEVHNKKHTVFFLTRRGCEVAAGLANQQYELALMEIKEKWEAQRAEAKKEGDSA